MTGARPCGIRNLNRGHFVAIAVCGTLAAVRGGGPGRSGSSDRARPRDRRTCTPRTSTFAATRPPRFGLSDRNVQREALPVLIDRLTKEKDGQVRLAVLDTLTALGPDAASAVPALVQTLRTDFGGRGSEASHQDYRSALALAAIGKPAVEGLRGLLKERKESVRAEVAMALGSNRARRGSGRSRPDPAARRQERTYSDAKPSRRSGESARPRSSL